MKADTRKIVDDKCAFLVPPEPTTIADHIKRLQSDPQLARRMGLHGRKIAGQYSWDDTAQKLLSIIEECHRDWRSQHPRPRRKINRCLVGSHYFTWYREGYGSAHWNDSAIHGGLSDTPRIGYYDSNDGDTIRYHLKLMTEAKLDFVCFNLHVGDSGLDKSQLWGAIVMCRLAREMKLRLRFAVNICLYTRDEHAIKQALLIIRDEFLASDSALHFNNKPVLFLFWNKPINRDHGVINAIRELTEGTFRIALSAHGSDPRAEARSLSSLFDSYGLFSPLTIGPMIYWEKLWQAAYDAGAAMTGRCRVMTISPGYDDTPLEDPNRRNNPIRMVLRKDGAIYRRMIDFVLHQKSEPHITLISTFNEFHENTHIEPTVKLGDSYLRMTAQFIAALKRKARGATKKS